MSPEVQKILGSNNPETHRDFVRKANDEQLDEYISDIAGNEQYHRMGVAERDRRWKAEEAERLNNIQCQTGKILADVSKIDDQLHRTHKLHKWVLFFALIAAVDVLVKWFWPEEQRHGQTPSMASSNAAPQTTRSNVAATPSSNGAPQITSSNTVSSAPSSNAAPTITSSNAVLPEP